MYKFYWTLILNFDAFRTDLIWIYKFYKELKTIECCMFHFLLWYHANLTWRKTITKRAREMKPRVTSIAHSETERERVPQRAQNQSPALSAAERAPAWASRRRLPHSLLVSVSVSSVLVEHWSAAGVFWRELSRAKNEAFPVGCVRTFFFLFLREAWEENSRGLFGTSPTRIQFVVLCCAVPSVSFPMQNLDRVSYLWPFSRKAGRIVNKICAFFSVC